MVFYNKERKLRLAIGNGYAPDREWIEIDLNQIKNEKKPIYKKVEEEKLSSLQKDFLTWEGKFLKAKGISEKIKVSEDFFKKTSYPYFAYMQARFLYFNKKYKEAWKVLETAERKGLLTDFLFQLKALTALKLNKPEKAEEALAQLDRLGEEALYYKAQVLFRLGDYWRKRGERVKASKYFREFKKIVFLHQAYNSPLLKRLLQKAS